MVHGIAAWIFLHWARGYWELPKWIFLNWVRGYREFPNWIRECWKYLLCQWTRTGYYRGMGYAVNELCRNVSDLNELNSICIDMISRNFFDCKSSSSRRYFHVLMYFETIMVFSWDSFIGYYHDQKGIFMTRSRGYFHISIEEVFSWLDQYRNYRGFSNMTRIKLDLYVVKWELVGWWILSSLLRAWQRNIRVAQRKRKYVKGTVIVTEYSDKKFRGQNFYKRGRIVTSPTQETLRPSCKYKKWVENPRVRVFKH